MLLESDLYGEGRENNAKGCPSRHPFFISYGSLTARAFQDTADGSPPQHKRFSPARSPLRWACSISSMLQVLSSTSRPQSAAHLHDRRSPNGIAHLHPDP